MSFSASVSASTSEVSLTLRLEISDEALGVCPVCQGSCDEEFAFVDRRRLALEEMSRELARLIDTLPLKIHERAVAELSDLVSMQEQACADLKKE